MGTRARPYAFSQCYYTTYNKHHSVTTHLGCGEMYIVYNCPSNAMHSIGQSIKSPVSVRPTFLNFFPSTFPFPFSIFLPLSLLYPLFLSLPFFPSPFPLLSIPFLLPLSLPFSSPLFFSLFSYVGCLVYLKPFRHNLLLKCVLQPKIAKSQ